MFNRGDKVIAISGPQNVRYKLLDRYEKIIGYPYWKCRELDLYGSETKYIVLILEIALVMT